MWSRALCGGTGHYLCNLQTVFVSKLYEGIFCLVRCLQAKLVYSDSEHNSGSLKNTAHLNKITALCNVCLTRQMNLLNGTMLLNSGGLWNLISQCKKQQNKTQIEDFYNQKEVLWWQWLMLRIHTMNAKRLILPRMLRHSSEYRFGNLVIPGAGRGKGFSLHPCYANNLLSCSYYEHLSKPAPKGKGIPWSLSSNTWPTYLTNIPNQYIH